MRSQIPIVAVMRENYAFLMDANKNPLQKMPPAQRFQTMVYLSVMWTTLFGAAFGSWYWYGQLMAAHMLVILGLVVTSLTFSSYRSDGIIRRE